MKPERRPIVIEHVRPAVDDGRYPAKRVVGETLAVSAAYEQVRAVLGHLRADSLRYSGQKTPH